MKKLMYVLALAAALAAGSFAAVTVAGATNPNNPPDTDHQVQICHAVAADTGGNQHNGYNLETVDKDSISTGPNGHDGHNNVGGSGRSDIIPAFAAGSTSGPPPKSWNAYGGKGDASWIANGCAAPGTTTTTTPSTTTNETTTNETTTSETTTTTDQTTTVVTTTTPTTTTTPSTTTTRTCPDGLPPNAGKDGQAGNNDCDHTTTTDPGTTTTTTTPGSTTTGTTPAPPTTTTGATPPAAKPGPKAPAKRAAKAGGRAPGSKPGELPFTGLPIWLYALAGAAMLGTGVALRRRA